MVDRPAGAGDPARQLADLEARLSGLSRGGSGYSGGIAAGIAALPSLQEGLTAAGKGTASFLNKIAPELGDRTAGLVNFLGHLSPASDVSGALRGSGIFGQGIMAGDPSKIVSGGSELLGSLGAAVLPGSYAPLDPAMFIGVFGAKNLGKDVAENLTKAKIMEKKADTDIHLGGLGRTPEQDLELTRYAASKNKDLNENIWENTGWFKSPDNLWRMEIHTAENFKLKDPNVKDWSDIPDGTRYRYGNRTLKSSLRWEDFLSFPDLEKAYPGIKDIQLDLSLSKHNTEVGNYRPAFGKGSPRITISAKSPEELKSAILHEVQHYIQYQEGFAKGAGLKNLTERLARGDQQVQKWIKDARPELSKQAEDNLKDAKHIEDRLPIVSDPKKTLADREKIRLLRKDSEKIHEVLSGSENYPFEQMDAEMFKGVTKERKEQLKLLLRWVYAKHAGEIEARLVQDRMDFTPKQRFPEHIKGGDSEAISPLEVPSWGSLKIPEQIVERVGVVDFAHGGPIYASEVLHMQEGGDPRYDRFGRERPQYVDPAGGYQITDDYGWLNEQETPPEPVVPLGSSIPLTILRNTPAGRAAQGLSALSRLLPKSVLNQLSKGVNWLQKTPFNPFGLEEPPVTTVERGIGALIRAPAPYATSDTPPPSPSPSAGVAALAPEARDMTRPTPYEEDPMLDSVLQEARNVGPGARNVGPETQAGRSPIGLYSQLEQAVLDLKQESFSSEHALTTLGKNAKNVEIEWSGLKEWLKDRPSAKVTKQELLDFVRSNDIKVIERRYDAPSSRQLEAEKKRLIGDLTELQRLGSSYPGISETIASVRQELTDNQNLRADMAVYPDRYRSPKFPGQTLSGGTNSRDLLLQRVAGQSLSKTDEARLQQLLSNKDQLSYPDRQSLEEKIEMEALRRKSDKGKRLAYRDPHYQQVNTIAWIRLKDVSQEVDPRTGEPKPMLYTAVETPDFRDRVYRPVDATTRALELSGDLQSDHAQKGGKEGFLGPEILVEGKNKEYWLERFNELYAESNARGQPIANLTGAEIDRRRLLEAGMLQRSSGELEGHLRQATENLLKFRSLEAERPMESAGAVLDTPFKKEEHWAGLMLKHMLREAANPPQGQKYDMLTWTPGEIQVQRMMGGRRFAENILYRQPIGEDGKPLTGIGSHGQLEVYDKRGKELINSKYATRESIERRLGKAVAKRLLAQKPYITTQGDASVYTLEAHTDSGAVDMSPESSGIASERGIPFGHYQKNLRFYDQTIGNTFRQILKPLIGKEAAKKAVGHVWRRVDESTIKKLAQDPVALRSGVVDVEKGLIRMHSLNLTPELLEKVRAGLAKFAEGGPIFKAGGGLAAMAPEARGMFGEPRPMTKKPRLADHGPGANPGVASLCGAARNMNRSVVA